MKRLLLLCWLPLMAQADTLYKCTDAQGVALYTNQRQAPGLCRLLYQSASPGHAPAAGKRPAAPSTAAGEFPRVTPAEQKRRDVDRLAILQQELANEQRLLDAERNQVESAALHQRNILALEQEIRRVK